ncbi:MAG: methylenetetrahydrofolate--tRNA-(uracil(54)-C(5))-methyltransferase (FADH(2)-oxidizing) TrmFO [Deltaproteobacteria bacterium]|nr:methylenetetrahydrofolate--tRNA-(uracil(54)-C(5))-methyltransferase (FADH(2)-oxidizing) TrmFO [Deltaproteobacteria bacterium]
MSSQESIIIIGGGLAGCEAAWQLLRHEHPVTLYEMKPSVFSPAHRSAHLAELVCSNSLRSNAIENAVGLLKEEMRMLNSLIMEAAAATAVPAGKALAVNRNQFSLYIEERLLTQKKIKIIREEIREVPAHRIVIIATGPLTSNALSASITNLTGSNYLYFYDAISPIIEGESINFDRVFRSSRYDSDGGDYINCPMEKDEYEKFWIALKEGEDVPLRHFEEAKYFAGCLPVEHLARSGKDTLIFGPMKPVGLTNPKTGKQPYAVVQLRQEDREGILFNMVGFQTKLTWPEQRRVFRMIPSLENAEFVRHGSIHRNTFINSPALLNNALQLRTNNMIFFAGQITGVEGYVESAAMGLIAGLNASCVLSGRKNVPPPHTTAIGALLHYITHADHKTFQPMNVNFGFFPPLARKIRKKDRGLHYAYRALRALKEWQDNAGLSHQNPAALSS